MSARGLFIVLGICVAVGLVAAGGLAYLRSIDFSAYRSVIVDRLERVTGRDVSIDGDFDVSLSLTPVLIAEDVTLGNAGWGSRPAMARAERIELEIEILPLLLDGDVRIDRLMVVRSDIFLETDAEGNGNWEFHRGRPPESADEPFDPGQFLLEDVTIVDARVAWQAAGSDRSDEIRIDRVVWQAEDVTSRLDLSGRGLYRSLPVEVAGTVGSITNLLRESNPYPVDLRVTSAANIEATIKGQLGADSQGGDFALEVNATGADIEPLGSLTGLSLPSFGPFEAHVVLINREERLMARQIRAAVGDPQSMQVRARGSIAAITAGEGVDLRLSAEGENLRRLAALAGIEIGAFGPYTISTRLTNPDGGDPVLTDIEATAGGEATRVTATGAIRRPLAGEGLDLTVTAEGTGLDGLSPLVGTDLPPLGPYRIGGHLTDPAEAYRLEEMEARIGRSRVGGRILLALPENERPRIEGALRSARLDLDQILAAWSPPPAEQPPPETEEEGRIFSDDGLELDALRALDADLDVRAAEVVLGEITLEDVGLDLVLREGRLVIEPIAARMADGQVAGQLMLDATDPPSVAAAAQVEIAGLDVAALMGRFTDAENLSGQADIELDLESTGPSLRALMSQLNGRAVLVMPEGHIVGTDLHRLVADLGVLNLLSRPFRRPQPEEAIEINCLVGESVIEDGRAAIELLLDTGRMTLVGRGTVDLGAETIDLALVPEPKSGRLSAVAVPVDVEGPLSGPAIRPRTGAAVGEGVRGIIGGLLVPLNLFAGLVGERAEAVCPPAVAEATGGAAAPDQVPDEAEAGTAETLQRRRR